MTGFRRYVGRRLVLLAFVIWCVLTIMFTLFQLLPGDPTSIFVDSNFSVEMIERQRQLWGLNDPVLPIVIDEGGIRFEADNQFFKYVTATAQGDFGLSFVARGMRFYLLAFLLSRYGPQARVILEERLGFWVTIGAVVLVIGIVGAVYLF